jgi:hypothetical protein
LDATSAENITYPENKFIVGLKEVKETGAMFLPSPIKLTAMI